MDKVRMYSIFWDLHVRRRGIKTVCWFLILWGVGLAGAPVAPGEMVDRIVAVVNDDIILQSDVDAAMAPYREKLKQNGYTDVQQNLALADQRPYLLEQLILEKLTDQQAKRLKINVSDAEVDANIKRIKKMKGYSDESFRQSIKMEGLTVAQYWEQMKERLLRTKLVQREVNAKIVITDEDARAYYEKHRDQYAGKTQYHLRRILVMRRDSTAAEATASAKERIDRVYERLQAGEDFASLAAVYSDANDAADGGDLGTYEAGHLAPEIKEALKGLRKGQFSRVIDSEQGYQILYLEDVVHSGGKSLEEARTEIQDHLFAEIVEQKFKAWVKALRDKAHVKIME